MVVSEEHSGVRRHRRRHSASARQMRVSRAQRVHPLEQNRGLARRVEELGRSFRCPLRPCVLRQCFLLQGAHASVRNNVMNVEIITFHDAPAAPEDRERSDRRRGGASESRAAGCRLERPACEPRCHVQALSTL